MGGIFLYIRPAGGSVENVIGREMHETRVDLAAGHREIANREAIGEKGRQRLFFRDVHLVVGCRIDDYGRVEFGERSFDSSAIAYIHRRSIKACDLVSAVSKFFHQLHAKLPTTAENDRSEEHTSE